MRQLEFVARPAMSASLMDEPVYESGGHTASSGLGRPHLRPMAFELRGDEPRRPEMGPFPHRVPIRGPDLGHGLEHLLPAMPMARRVGPGMERMLHKRVPRPSQIAKWVAKKFSGLGDPHSHVASYVQVLDAERIEDFRTQYQAFGRGKCCRLVSIAA